MKRIVTTIVCAALLGVGTASATITPTGSKVRITPLVTRGLPPPAISPGQKATVSLSPTAQVNKPPAYATLPAQAGKVRSTVTTNLLGGKSWSILAFGDKYISLCAPNREKMSCSPTVATSVMTDIKIGAAAGPNGEPLLIFTTATSTKRTPKAIVFAINKFNARIKKQVAHFDRMAVSYAPSPRQSALTVGASSNAIMEPSRCSFDDSGELDCAGGSSEGGGGGNEGGGVNEGGGGAGAGDPVPTDTGCWECNYPPGNNNGDPEPEIAPNIPVVIINGQRPADEPMASLPTCAPIGPFTIECGRMPPVIGGEPQELPRNIPWFSQSWCNFSSVFCSSGQEPDNERGDNSEHSGKTIGQLFDICENIYNVELDVCNADYKMRKDSRMYGACTSKAAVRMSACRTTARRVTNNGEHPAP